MVQSVVQFAKINYADKVVVLRAENWFCRQQKPDDHWCWRAYFMWATTV